MDGKNIFRIEDLIDLAERIYKKYGNIGISIRLDEHKLAPVKQIGVAGIDVENLSQDNKFLCFSPMILNDSSEDKK